MKYNPTDTRTWMVEDNPSTKIVKLGTNSMSDTELLSVILSIGSFPASELAKKLFSEAHNDLNTLATMSYTLAITILLYRCA